MLQHLFNGYKRIKSYWIIVDQKEVNKLLWATKLSEVIGDFVPLKKKGRDFAGRCPFCRAKTYNDFHFVVSDYRRRYKCFRCGISGKHPTSFLIRYFKTEGFYSIISFINSKYHDNKYNFKDIVRSVEGHYMDENSSFLDPF